MTERNSASGLLIDLEDDCQLIEDGERVLFKRKALGVYRRGKYVESKSFVEFDCEKASVQPLTGKEQLQLPEGDRNRQHLWIYTPFAVKENDVMVRMGTEYEVQVVEDWGSYRKARGVKIDVDRN